MPHNNDIRHGEAERLLDGLNPQEDDSISSNGCDLLGEETAAEIKNKERIISRQDQAIQERDQAIRAKDQELAERHEEHELRKEFIHIIYTFVSTVVYAALLLTFFTAAGMIHLSDAVLIAMLTTTVANVLGCLFIAFKWLFPCNTKSEDSSKKL